MLNLRDRLLRIKSASKNTEEPIIQPLMPFNAGNIDENKKTIPFFTEILQGTQKRTVRLPLEKRVMDLSHKDLPVIIPDLFTYPHKLQAENIVFFDLETTGLSGGAGTVAFLAAFGKFVCDATVLEVEQYLLDDYSGETGFIETILEHCRGPKKIIVTYNGKSFDSQILKTRCIMNGKHPPEFFHADLLHPARCLWKRKIESCSQSGIEKNILNIERKDDVPGSLAPEIWFSFLRTGATKELLGICDHNVRDIQGLASIFTALTQIVQDPCHFSEVYNVDMEALAFRYRRCNNGGVSSVQNTLMESAALSGGTKAARYIAIIEEWQRKDYETALFWTQTALLDNKLNSSEKADFLKREARLIRKRGTLGK
ncbi:hypothetical protein FACS1894190_01220 [Spirochaetia bacterium]|nr:hypothetical protein FACS1894190_01220 [Spirochaetia bacterium]